MPAYRKTENEKTGIWLDQYGVRLYVGDVLDNLALFPDKSVQCVITSPPYWGLRDYQIGGQLGTEKCPDCGIRDSARCNRCYVCNLVNVFSEVKRVLRDDGTLWLVLGDTYASNRNGAKKQGTKGNNGIVPLGNQLGIPWRVALALQADGWILRQDIIWSKPDGMTESVNNRCTGNHDYVFLLTKQMDYYYDAEAIKEGTGSKLKDQANKKYETNNETGLPPHNGLKIRIEGRGNKRSVWTIATEKYPGGHFAIFPKLLVRPMILAGTSAKGQCLKCRQPWQRILDKASKETLGWEPGCECGEGKSVVPQTVLDPFAGTCTVGEVCLQEGRRFVGIEINEGYLEQARKRLFVEGDLKKELYRQLRKRRGKKP